MNSKFSLQMPRMHGAAVQCCMCIVGVFLFLGGLIMLVTGVCLILNYGVFDENLLPPDLQNDEGKRTVGIILTCCGLFAILISVVASALYLCTKSKPATIKPNELNRTPNTARGTPDRPDQRRVDRRPGTGKQPSNGNVRPQPNTKSIPGSTEVIHPRQTGHRKGRNHRKIKHRGRRLEEIKEQDAISRKTVEGAALTDTYIDANITPRSGSFSSQFTLEEPRNPRIVVGTDEIGRPPSTDSASTSQISDVSNFRTLENDKSRREVQFMSDSVRFNNGNYDTISKDSVSLFKENGVIVNGRDSEEGSIVSERYIDKHQMSTSSFNSFNDKFSAGGNDFTAQGHLPDVSSSDESCVSYKVSSLTEMHGNSTFGRVTSQAGETENNKRLKIQAVSDGKISSISETKPRSATGKQNESNDNSKDMTSDTQGFKTHPSVDISNDDSFV